MSKRSSFECSFLAPSAVERKHFKIACVEINAGTHNLFNFNGLIGIIDNLHIAAGIGDAGGADADLGNGAPVAAQLNDIPHIVFVFEDHEQTGDHVSDEALCAKADNQSHNSKAGEQGGQIHTDDGHAPEDAQQHDHVVEGGQDQVQNGLAAASLGLHGVQQGQADDADHLQQQNHDDQLKQGDPVEANDGRDLTHIAEHGAHGIGQRTGDGSRQEGDQGRIGDEQHAGQHQHQLQPTS